MFCSKCGAKNNDDAKFCEQCGTPPLGGLPKDSSNQKVSEPVVRSSVFYAQVKFDARREPSTSSKTVGTYPVNANFTLPYKSLNEAPEWVKVSWTDKKGVVNYGYLHKSWLGQNPVPVVAQNDELICPKCGSKNIHADKKGYSAGGGCLGAIVFGPLGLLCGQGGANKIRKTCLKCGKQF